MHQKIHHQIHYANTMLMNIGASPKKAINKTREHRIQRITFATGTNVADTHTA